MSTRASQVFGLSTRLIEVVCFTAMLETKGVQLLSFGVLFLFFFFLMFTCLLWEEGSKVMTLVFDM